MDTPFWIIIIKPSNICKIKLVTETYKEKIFNMINDNTNESYQEREICAPNIVESVETQPKKSDENAGK